jgi:hypothetical protein
VKELQRDRTGEKNLRIAIVAMFAVLWLCIAFFAGCGTNSGDSVSYDGTGGGTTNPTATATVPFQDQPLNFLTSAEDANGGMAVSFIDVFGAGIYANANKDRASNKGAAGTIISLTAKVLVNVVKNFAIGNPTQQEFATVQNELNSINSEIYQLNSEAATCMDQLAITEADLTTYINNITISQYTEDIDTYYASGSLKNLLYYSYCATVFCPASSSPSPSPTVTALPYSIPTPSPIPMPTWPLPSSLASVQQSIYSSDANCYVTEVTGTLSVPYDIKMIHDGICSSNEQMLMAYVNDVILNGPSTSGSATSGSSSGSGKKAQKGGSPKADPSPVPTPTYTPHSNIANPTSQDSVMNTYLLLEKYFLTLYCYQLKGLLILQNADNVLDSMNPNPPNPSTFSNYMDSRFKPWIMDELLAYNNAVNYLVVSMVDYRTKDQFNSDNNYLATGIAKDSVYYQVLARARILTVQILNSYGYDEGGLYGKIIVPANYLGSGTTATPEVSPTVTPTFSPAPFPTPLVNLAGSSTPAPLTQKMTTYRSIFPYPSWCGNYVSCDNNWTVADLYNTDLPSGTYTLTLNDGGLSITPWNHSNTQLGSGTVMYYCPNGNSSKYPPTSQPTDTNTVKFGFFSGRWNFGYEVFSNGPFSYWNISDAKFQFTWDATICTLTNPGLFNLADSTKPEYFSTDFATYLYPYAGNTSPTGLVNKMGSYQDTFSDTKNEPWFTGYKIYLRYFMAPAASNIYPQGLNGEVNATWFYNVTGGLNGTLDTSKPDNYATNYGVYSEDNVTQNILYLVNENNNLGSSLSWNDVKQTTLTPGHEYDLKTTCYYLNNPTGTYSQYLQWYLQIVYSGYAYIFAQP